MFFRIPGSIHAQAPKDKRCEVHHCALQVFRVLRLQSYLSRAGVASRRRSTELIESGQVWVNGRVVREAGFRIDPEKDGVRFKGRKVVVEKKVYYLFHKPRGVLTTVKDTHGRRTVADFFRSVPFRLYPVGRLDKESTGLLIMTNDGDLANRLTHPR